jgi:enoyl-[acyl-carrier protein] reductase II
MKNKVTEILGCKYPIVQGAMGVICNPELVAAVSEAGGFGLLATALTERTEVLREQIKAIKNLTSKPFGANLFLMNPLAEKFANVLAEEGVEAVTVSGGSPRTLIPVLHKLGIRALAVVPTVKVALNAETHGADAIIAEGSESGGVQGYQGASTMVLTPMVVDSVKVPVLAAGGIGDSRGYKAALALGAEGVQVGTRFIASKECIAHINYKNIIVRASESATELVDLGRFRIRALLTPLVEKLIEAERVENDFFEGKAMKDSWLKGDTAAGILPAGQISGLVHKVLTAKEIIEEMVS